MVPVIVIPVLNRYDLLERCLESIDYPVGTLLIIDNGGKAGLHDQPWLVDRRPSRQGGYGCTTTLCPTQEGRNQG